MAAAFADLHTDAGLSTLEGYLSGKTFISGYVLPGIGSCFLGSYCWRIKLPWIFLLLKFLHQKLDLIFFDTFRCSIWPVIFSWQFWILVESWRLITLSVPLMSFITFRNEISKDDVKVYAAVPKKPSGGFPNVTRWYDSIASVLAGRLAFFLPMLFSFFLFPIL